MCKKQEHAANPVTFPIYIARIYDRNVLTGVGDYEDILFSASKEMSQNKICQKNFLSEI